MFYTRCYLSDPTFETRSANTGGHTEEARLPPGFEKENPLDLSFKPVCPTPNSVVEAEEMFYLEQRKFAGLDGSQGLPPGLHRHISSIGGSSGTLLDPTLLRLGYRTDAALGGMLGTNMSSPFCVDRTPVSSSTPAFGAHHLMNSVFHQRERCLDQHGGICGAVRPPTQHLSPFFEPSPLSVPLRPTNSGIPEGNPNLGPRSFYGQNNPNSFGLPSFSLYPERNEEKGAFVALRPGAEKSVLNGTPLDATSYAEHLQRLGEHHVQQKKCVGACYSQSFGSLGQPPNSCSCCLSPQTTFCGRGPIGCLGKEHPCEKICNSTCGYFNPSLSYLGQHSATSDVHLAMNPYYSNFPEPVRREESFGSVFFSNPNLWGSGLIAAPISKAVVPAASPALKRKDSASFGQKESPHVAKDFPGSSTPAEHRDVVMKHRPNPTSGLSVETLKKESDEVIVIEDGPTSKCIKRHSSKPNIQLLEQRTKTKEHFQKDIQKQNDTQDTSSQSIKGVDPSNIRMKMPRLEAVTRSPNSADNTQGHEKKFSDPPPLTAAADITALSQASTTSSVYPSSLWTPHQPATSSTSFSINTYTSVTASTHHQSLNTSYTKKHKNADVDMCKPQIMFPSNHQFSQNVASSLPHSIRNLTHDIKPAAGLDIEEPGCSRAGKSSRHQTDLGHCHRVKQVDVDHTKEGSNYPSPPKEYQRADDIPPKSALPYDPYCFTQDKSEYTFNDSEGVVSPLDVSGLKKGRKKSMLQYLTNPEDYVVLKKKKTNYSDSTSNQPKLGKEKKELQSTSTKCIDGTSPSSSQENFFSKEIISEENDNIIKCLKPELIQSKHRSHSGSKEKSLTKKLKNIEFEEGFRKEAKRVCAKAKKKLRKRLLARLYEDRRESESEKETEKLSNKEAEKKIQHSNQAISQLSLIWRQRRLLNSCQTVKRRRLKSGLDMIAKPNRKKKSKTLTLQKLLEKELLKEQDVSIPLEGAFEVIEGKLPFDFTRGAPPEMKRIMVNKALGETILHRAARMGYKEVVLYCLETNYCDVNSRDNASYTPLHESCSRGNLEIASALVQYGGDVNASAAGGIRPLHDAVENDHVEIVRLLLSYGADPTIATYSGLTPLKLAKSSIMAEFLRGFFADTVGETTMNVILPWKFPGSACCLDAEETGYDVWDGLPLDLEDENEDKDDFLFEVSDTPHLPTFRLQLPGNNSKAMCNCLRLIDVLNNTGLTKERFLSMYSYAEIFPIPKHEIETSATCSQLLTGTRLDSLLSDATSDGSTTIDVVRLDDNIRDILGIETVTLR
ncbi:uncharacterized protein LOC106459594 isoform X2 [Limulus polyphemus]|uniref:Uncharacterized protein LOC106459594 isoform X2 n=1 Tax=Limulus polyphemus TaxID=6850 RepID=A0ABM1SDW2_LIMPO|nr:uncharacterized protein LOC106459594 isoform X2 [Limulus polyphemus]